MSRDDAMRIAAAIARATTTSWPSAVSKFISVMIDLGHPTSNCEEGLGGGDTDRNGKAWKLLEGRR